MGEEKLLNKVPVVEIHQPKKNRDINPFFRPNVLFSVKIKIVKNPWRFKIITFHFFSVKPHMPEKAIESTLSTILFLRIPEVEIMVQDGRIVADSCVSSLKACVPDDFPNLYMLLKIAATLPVTTCECERSISTMRRLNNYMRCTVGESKLSALALMHINHISYIIYHISTR